MVYEIIVLTLLLPAFVSAAVVFLELATSGNRPADERADRPAWLAGGVAAAGSFLLAYWLLKLADVDPTDYWHWLPQAIVAVTITSLLAAMAGRAWAWGIVAVVALVFARQMTPAWEDVVHLRWWVTCGLTLTMLAYLLLMWPLSDARHAKQGWLVALVMMLHFVAAAVIVFCCDWASLAQLCILPIVVFGVLALASWLYPRRQFLCGALPTFAVLFPTALLLAWYYTFGPISIWACALPAIGPLALLAALAVTARAPRSIGAIAILSTLIFPIFGVVAALVTAPPWPEH